MFDPGLYDLVDHALQIGSQKEKVQMKHNLTSRLIRAILPSKLLLGFCFVSILWGGGCSTPPAALENFLFVTTTNYVPKIVVVTNTIERIVTVTNQSGLVESQPVRETILTVQTNLLPTVTVQPSAAFVTTSSAAGAALNTLAPGAGSWLSLLLSAVAGFFALNRQRRLTQAVQLAAGHESKASTAQAVAENFAQSIEVIREVLKTTPQGQALDVKIVDMLQRNQMTVGIIREAVSIVENTVSNEAAKSAAQKILSLLPPQPPTQSV